MADTVTFVLDGEEIAAQKGQTIMEAADAAGVYIPRLCAFEGLPPQGACRVCTVFVNGRPQSACTHPVTEGIIVENDTEKLKEIRTKLIELLFVEGNHYCMFCEKSGNCELQALGYRFGMVAPTLPFMFPDREVDASHPDVLIDRNRCVLCGRCVRASKTFDGKQVFQFTGRGSHKKISVNAEANLGDTDLSTADKAVDVCPVGAILRKRQGYAVPVGQRMYDTEPIGSDIESKKE